MAKIFIDPGHGGRDPGAIGSNSRESDNVLKVAKRLKTLLESYGHTVRLSRSTDKYLTLSERARMANDWGAEYFISLHNNAAVNKSARGFETFIYNRTTNQKTKQFQNAVHDAIALQIGIRDRGKKQANFAVVRETKMPAVLIEYAFISNNEDEKILIERVNQLAEWTCDGIINAIGGTIKASPSNPVKRKPSQPVETVVSKPKANLKVDGYLGPLTIKALQRYFGTVIDGVISKPSLVIKALQRWLGVKADGYLGPITIRALQRRFGTPVDGKISRPSLVIKELQRRLNNGQL